MLCIYINSVFVFIHTTYTDFVDVFRSEDDEVVNIDYKRLYIYFCVFFFQFDTFFSCSFLVCLTTSDVCLYAMCQMKNFFMIIYSTEMENEKKALLFSAKICEFLCHCCFNI